MNGYIVMKQHKMDGIVVDQESYKVYDDETAAMFMAALIDEVEGEHGATGVVVPVHQA